MWLWDLWRGKTQTSQASGSSSKGKILLKVIWKVTLDIWLVVTVYIIAMYNVKSSLFLDVFMWTLWVFSYTQPVPKETYETESHRNLTYTVLKIFNISYFKVVSIYFLNFKTM